MKNFFTIIICFGFLSSFGQWNVSTGTTITWNPKMSTGMPLAYFFHAVNITASVNINTIGGGSFSNNYPLCNAPMIITYSLSGGASFIGTNATDAVSTSGDWESRFNWVYSDGTKTTIISTQNTTIPSSNLGTFNTFTFQVRTPNYTSNFVISTGITAGAGGTQCAPGTKDPNNNQLDDNQATDGFTNRTLPIQLLEFQTINKETSGIGLTWKTLNESNTSVFEIQRLYDGKNNEWMTVGTTKAAGNSSKELSYEYMDKTYAKTEKIFYRIKQIDQSGSFRYTDIRTIQFKEYSKVQLSGFPNPVHKNYHLAFNLSTDAKIGIELIDILGRPISRESYQARAGYNSRDIDFSALSAGTYILKIAGNEINDSMTVIKID